MAKIASRLPVSYAIVWWTDSAVFGDAVMDSEDPLLGPIEGVSVGVLVQDEPTHVTIALDYWEDGSFRNCQSICRSQITRIKILRG